MQFKDKGPSNVEMFALVQNISIAQMKCHK